jgi:hypothetical protein
MRVHCVELCVGRGRCVGHESNASAGRGIRTATPWHKTCKPSVVSAGVLCPDRAGGRTRRATRCALDVRSCWLAIPRFHHVVCPCLSRVVSGVAAYRGGCRVPLLRLNAFGVPLFSSDSSALPVRYLGTSYVGTRERGESGSRLRLEYLEYTLHRRAAHPRATPTGGVPGPRALPRQSSL